MNAPIVEQGYHPISYARYSSYESATFIICENSSMMFPRQSQLEQADSTNAWSETLL